MQKIECKSGRTKNVCLDTAVFFCKSQNLWHPIYPVRSFQRFVHEKPWGIFIYPPCSVQKPRCIWSSGSMASIWDTFVSLDSVVPGGSQMRDAWKTPVVLNSIPRCATFMGFWYILPTFYQKHQPFMWGKYGSYTNIVQMTYFIIEIIDMMFTFPNF